MLTPVEKISPPIFDNPKQKDVIELLETALKEAYGGTINGCALMLFYTDDCHKFDATPMNKFQVLGTLSRVMYKINKLGED